MMKNLVYGYYNKKGEYKIVHTINARLINAIHQGLDRNNGLVNIYVNIDFSQLDTIITISRMVDFNGEYLYHVNCEYKNCQNSIECCENEIKRAIEVIIDWFDEVDNYKASEEVETITAPEEVEEVPTTQTQTQKNNVVSIPENIKVYGTISEYFIEGEGWISANYDIIMVSGATVNT